MRPLWAIKAKDEQRYQEVKMNNLRQKRDEWNMMGFVAVVTAIVCFCVAILGL